MELWIRSQDKERLIKVDNLYVEFNGDVDPTLCPYKVVTNRCIDLGIYKTKERALEVLDEIQKLLMPISEYKQEVDNLIINYKNIDTAIYEMPEN